jgi:hypothetical protein
MNDGSNVEVTNFWPGESPEYPLPEKYFKRKN